MQAHLSSRQRGNGDERLLNNESSTAELWKGSQLTSTTPCPKPRSAHPGGAHGSQSRIAQSSTHIDNPGAYSRTLYWRAGILPQRQ